MTTHAKRGRLAALVALGIVLLSPGTATGAGSQADPESVCIESAKERQLKSWTCLGGTLTYFDQSTRGPGRHAIVSDQIVPATVDLHSVEPEEENSSWSMDRIAPRSTVDPDNYWCEGGASVCRNVGNDFNGKVKGNIIWGNSKGVRGEFDLVLKTKLEMRSVAAQSSPITATGS